ncbi:MAG: methyltransferase domain-containing protein [Asgard group archaeon]|nr:methyltransferase domain-containing protein [Asgard group archaeon]
MPNLEQINDSVIMTKIKETVKKKYAEALEKSKKDKDTTCCTEGSPVEHKRPEKGLFSGELIAPSFGCIYDLPGKAEIKEGDVIVDFGSGSGYDLIRAAKITGDKGKVIGIDMTLDMVKQAQDNAQKMNLTNIEVKLGEIENVPLDDNIADIVISNCVINLSPDKQAVFNEAYRILKPGGRLVDADKIADKELPKSLQENSDAWCGCVSGALTKEGYEEVIGKAGFIDIDIELADQSSFKWEGKDIILHNGILRAKKQ